MVGLEEVFIMCVCKIGLQKICKTFASDLGSYFEIMRGFQKHLGLGSFEVPKKFRVDGTGGNMVE